MRRLTGVADELPGAIRFDYLEESGIPLPLPGDVFALYLGHVAASSPTST